MRAARLRAGTGAAGAVKRIAAIVAVLVVAVALARGRWSPGAGDDGTPTRCARSSTTPGSSSPARTSRSPASRSARSSRSTSRRTSRRPSCCAIDDPGYQDFRRDASCIVRPQSLIGEKFVECEPTQKRAVGAEPPPPLSKIDDGPGEGQYLLPVEQHRAVGRPRPDQQHAAAALPRAPVADPQRARRDRRRPRRGRRAGDPPRQPGAQGDRQGAGDPGVAEPGARRTSPATATRSSRRWRASAATSRALASSAEVAQATAEAARDFAQDIQKLPASSCASCARR